MLVEEFMSIADGQAVLRHDADGDRPLTLDCTASLSRLGTRAYPPALKDLAPKVPHHHTYTLTHTRTPPVDSSCALLLVGALDASGSIHTCLVASAPFGSAHATAYDLDPVLVHTRVPPVGPLHSGVTHAGEPAPGGVRCGMGRALPLLMLRRCMPAILCSRQRWHHHGRQGHVEASVSEQRRLEASAMHTSGAAAGGAREASRRVCAGEV